MIEHAELDRELGLLVGIALTEGGDPWSLDASLDELAALADTAGVTVVGRASQRLARPNPATFVGSGKVIELRAAAVELGVDVVLFDHELSPRQQRNLEQALEVKLLDRTALILDVFARHAHTREGMLQVELAQYEYRLPRLTRMWTHLARQAGGRAGGTSGGVGVRGPGETQLEIDRREIGRRISLLKGQIEQLRQQRRQSRRQRQRAGLPVVALVGYTNAGKSTLMKRLTDADVYIADQLFATLDPTTRRIDLPSGRHALATDTVGFIQKLPTQVVAAFRATLEEVSEADLLLHVVDVTHPDAVLQAETVEQVLDDLGVTDIPMVVAGNKIDRLTDGESGDGRRATDQRPAGAAAGLGGANVERGAGRTSESGRDADESGRGADEPDLGADGPGRGADGPGLGADDPDRAAAPDNALDLLREVYPDIVPISARSGHGLERLLTAVEDELQSRLVLVSALIPYSAGDVLSQIHAHGVVLAERFEPEGTHVEARVPSSLLGSLRPYVEVPDGTPAP